MSLFDNEHCNKYIDEEIEVNTEENEQNPCSNCDSTSMEACLLLRHCKYWCSSKKRNW